MDQNGIKWNKLELQLQSENVYNKSCQAYHKSKFGKKNFLKKSDQNGINWNYSSNQKMSLTKVVRLAMKVKTVEKNLKNKNWIKIE